MNIRPRNVFFAAGLFFAASCSPSGSALEKYNRSGPFFGSFVQVDVCYEPAREAQVIAAVDQVWTRFADIHSRLSVYDPNSDLNTINNSYPDAVTVGSDTYQLIKDSLEYHVISQNLFDITFSPLRKLWKESAKKNRLPSAEEIMAARAKLGVDKIELLPDHQIRLLSPEVKLNIDSIGDGYAADEAARILRENGFNNFLVDASGELYAGGKSCEGRPWRIGVRDPHDTSKMIDVIELSDAAVSTSGNYEQYFEIEGIRWSHIINPLTGYPGRDTASATVIAPRAQFADFWSTALCLMDPEDGIALTEALGSDVAAMVVIESAGYSLKHTSSRYKAL